MSNNLLEFLKENTQEQDIIFFLSGPDQWRKHIDIWGLTAIFNHITVYNTYFSLESSVKIGGDLQI